MGQVIHLCRACGFEIPVDVRECPECRLPDAPPSLAARQAAGLALPTRSVHRLPHTAPRHELSAPAEGPIQAARAAFSFTGAFISVALLGIVLGWVIRLDRFVLSMPDGLVTAIDTVTTVATLAAVVGLALGLGALAVRAAHRLSVELVERADTHPTR